MAQPIQPKPIKPKASAPEAGNAAPNAPKATDPTAEDDELSMVKLLILVVAIVVSSVLSAGAATYFLAPMVLVPAITESIVAELPAGEGEEGGEEGEEAPHASVVGMNLEFDEFTVNLKPDPTRRGNQYLRAKIAMSLKVPPEQDCTAPAHGEGHEAAAAPAEGGHGGGAPAADPMEACNKAFNSHMGRYVPSIRDIVNTALMSRSASTLGSGDGQEALKDEIKEEVTHLIAGDGYEVLRVNFSDFIIQY
ncbi:MAG: flagellar basal body-associated FliL family protein [Vampirovibrionales bacterium]|nr:flagellar basal body-associated FliL family protein [Vampirovibrionales bacterium]